jgi:hypothetical protein
MNNKLCKIRMMLALMLLLSGLGLAQSSASPNAADKSWKAFWTKFSQAVKTKNRQVFISLISKKYFRDPGGEMINGRLNQAGWRRLKNSVSLGTKPDKCRFICRTTRNADPVSALVFVFVNNRWYFIGEQGE